MNILKKNRVIFVTPRENKDVKGGIASWTTKLENQRLPEGYQFKIVDSSVMFGRGIFNFTNYNFFYESIRTLRILISIVLIIISFRAKILHINSSISKYGILRDFTCLMIGKFFGLKTFVHFRGNLPQEWQKNSKVSKRILDMLIKLSHGSIAINLPSKAFLDKRKITNNSFKLESFIEQSDIVNVREYSQTTDRMNIIFIGAFIKEKGAEEMIALSKDFPDINFNIAGQVAQKYEDIISSSNNFFNHGILDRVEVLNALKENDVLIFPSHSEGFPNVVLEAMSQGLPVIASNVGAIPEMIIQDKGGCLSNVGDVQAYKEDIQKLLLSPSMREEMGKYNLNRAHEHFTYEVVIRKMIRIYET